MAVIQNGLPPIMAGDAFDPGCSHLEVNFSNSNKTATLIDDFFDFTQCVLGCNKYVVGEHDIRIRLDNISANNHSFIGTTGRLNPILNDVFPFPGFSLWNITDRWCFTPDGIPHEIDDLGRPWISGDVLHLHLDCENHTLRISHLRTGSSHTIFNVIGVQRFFIAMTTEGSEFSLI